MVNEQPSNHILANTQTIYSHETKKNAGIPWGVKTRYPTKETDSCIKPSSSAVHMKRVINREPKFSHQSIKIYIGRGYVLEIFRANDKCQWCKFWKGNFLDNLKYSNHDTRIARTHLWDIACVPFVCGNMYRYTVLGMRMVKPCYGGEEAVDIQNTNQRQIMKT